MVDRFYNGCNINLLQFSSVSWLGNKNKNLKIPDRNLLQIKRIQFYAEKFSANFSGR